MPAANPSIHRPRRRWAFTLTELLIAIAMVLILMTGIVRVFKYATDSIGAGMAVSDLVRIQRVLDNVIPADAAGLSINTTKCPAILMDSQQNDPNVAQPNGNTINPNTGSGDYGVMQGPIFLNKTDQANIATLTTSQVQFRQDTFSFFSRGNFTRQTGNDGTFVSPMASTWAWIWYGHLWLPDNTATFHPTSTTDGVWTYPGGGTAVNNPNNFYAQQWQLGRVAMLILPKNVSQVAANTKPYTDIAPAQWPGATTANIRQYQSFIDEFPNPAQIPANTPWISPLAFGSAAYDYSANRSVEYQDQYNNGVGQSVVENSPIYQIQQSRYDLAGVTANVTGDPFQDYFNTRLNYGSNAVISASYVQQWWSPLPNPANTAAAPVGRTLNYRFEANPYPVRPLDTTVTGAGGGAAKSAGIVPFLASGCARFYVEYAGDFLDQNPTTGQVTSNIVTAGFVPDGTDFYLDVNGIRHIRWYGLPRSVTGSAQIDTNVAGLASGSSFYYTADVLPLAYYLNPTTFATSLPNVANFEKLVFAYSPPNPANHYICAWDASASTSPVHDVRPTMFRITIELADPSGRLGNTRVIQYVLPVQQQ